MPEVPAPQVSVVLPTRDRAHLVARAVASVLSQHGPSLELVVVDDGSTDGTAAVLAALHDPRLRVVRGRSAGAGAARNAGIRAARGAWVAFQDDDDEWLPGKLQAQWEATRRAPPPAVVYTDMERHTPDGAVRPYPAPDPPRGLVDARRDWSPLGIGLQSCMVRRDLLEAVGGFDEGLGRFIDLDLLLRLVPHGPFVRIARPLVRYHDTPGISRDLRKAAEARIALLGRHADALPRSARAWQRHRIGVLYCSSGDLRAGRPHLWRAWTAQPWRADFLAIALAATGRAPYRLAQRLNRGGR